MASSVGNKIIQPLTANTYHSNTTMKKSTEFSLVAVKSEIEKEYKKFEELVASDDVARLADCYTTDAKFMSAGSPAGVISKK